MTDDKDKGDKLNKKEISDAVNTLLGFTGEEAIDWTRLKFVHLLKFYVKLVNPKELGKIAVNIGDQVLPERVSQGIAGAVDKVGGGGLLGAVLDGDFENRPGLRLLKRLASRALNVVETEEKRGGGKG